MAAADPLAKESASIALPGLARALISAGKLPAKTAEEIYQKSLSGRSNFIAELTGTGAVSAADLAHTLSSAFGAPCSISMPSMRSACPRICWTPSCARPTGSWC